MNYSDIETFTKKGHPIDNFNEEIALKLYKKRSKISASIDEIKIFMEDQDNSFLTKTEEGFVPFQREVRSTNYKLFQILGSIESEEKDEFGDYNNVPLEISVDRSVDYMNSRMIFLKICFTPAKITVVLTNNYFHKVYKTIDVEKEITNGKHCYLCLTDYDTECEDEMIVKNTCCGQYCCIGCYEAVKDKTKCDTCKQAVKR